MLIERLDSFSHFWTKLTATLSAVRHALTLIVISLCRFRYSVGKYVAQI